MSIHEVSIRTNINGKEGFWTVIGEKITEGVYITPAITDVGYTGDWTITHGQSGRRIANLTACLYCVTEAAEKHLARSSVDWTRPYEALKDDSLALEIVKALNENLQTCYRQVSMCGGVISRSES